MCCMSSALLNVDGCRCTRYDVIEHNQNLVITHDHALSMAEFPCVTRACFSVSKLSNGDASFQIGLESVSLPFLDADTTPEYLVFFSQVFTSPASVRSLPCRHTPSLEQCLRLILETQLLFFYATCQHLTLKIYLKLHACVV
jgi:hypothetical protein